MKLFYKFKTKFLFSISVIIFAVIACSYLFQSTILFEVIKSDIKEELKKNVNFVNQTISMTVNEAWIKGTMTVLGFSEIDSAKDWNAFDIKDRLMAISQNYNNIFVEVFDYSGEAIIRSSNLPIAVYSKVEPKLLELKLNLGAIPPKIIEINGSKYIRVYLKAAGNKNRNGFVVITMELSNRFFDEMKQDFMNNEIRKYFIGDITIYNSVFNVCATTIIDDKGERLYRRAKYSGHGQSFYKEDGKWLSYYRYFPAYEIWIEISYPMNRLKNIVIQKNIWFIDIILITLAIFILYIILSRMIFPVNEIIRGISEVKRGNLNIKIGFDGNDEMGEAVLNFNEMVENINKNKEMEQRYSNLDKIASVGRLAAGVAHEIKNPLSSIYMIIGMYHEEFERIKFKQEDFEIILEEIKRINGIIENLLEFAKSDVMKIEEYDIIKSIREMSRLAKEAAKGRGNIIKVISKEETAMVICDINMMKQLFLNLILNSIEACSNGNIEIEIEKSDVEIVICVRDNGKGMEPETLKKAMEPFYTTKVKGTGLGLAIVKKILGLHNFRYKLESEKGAGTSFTIFIDIEDNRNLKCVEPYVEKEILERRE